MDVSSNDSQIYPFGLDSGKIAAELRDIADRVERGEYLPQSIMDLTTAKHDDYTIKRVVLTYAAKKE